MIDAIAWLGWAVLAVLLVALAFLPRARPRIRPAQAEPEPNPYQCQKCRNASQAARHDPDGLCPWCRAETSERVKAAHVDAMFDRLMDAS